MTKLLLKGPLPLDWKKRSWTNPVTGEVGWEYHTPIYLVLASVEGRRGGVWGPPMVSVSRKDRTMPSEAEIERIRVMLVGDYEWERIGEHETEAARRALYAAGMPGSHTVNV